MARAGLGLEYIKIWGRWDSDAVKEYCTDAVAEATSSCIGKAMCESRGDLATAWTWARRRWLRR